MTPRPLFIGEAGPSDVAALLELERRCASHPWTDGHFRSELEPVNRGRILVAREVDPGGSVTVVGFCVYRLVADEMHVFNLAVSPERRRQALGRRLLRTALGAARRAAASRALLEVRAGNEAALRLYTSEGFTVAGRRRAYYLEPLEDAVCLQRPLT